MGVSSQQNKLNKVILKVVTKTKGSLRSFIDWVLFVVTLVQGGHFASFFFKRGFDISQLPVALNAPYFPFPAIFQLFPNNWGCICPSFVYPIFLCVWTYCTEPYLGWCDNWLFAFLFYRLFIYFFSEWFYCALSLRLFLHVSHLLFFFSFYFFYVRRQNTEGFFCVKCPLLNPRLNETYEM